MTAKELAKRLLALPESQQAQNVCVHDADGKIQLVTNLEPLDLDDLDGDVPPQMLLLS